jgi:hypothetical protein
MHCAYRGRRTLSVEFPEFQGRVAAELDDQDLSGPDRMDAAERNFGSGITRAQVMEYLSHTYGAVFVADLAKHLS